MKILQGTTFFCYLCYEIL